MAPSLKITSFVIATIFLLATPEAQGWAPVDDQVVDMRVVEQVVTLPGSVGMIDGSSLCMDCLCCAKGNPGNCQKIKCCAKRNCKPTGTCTVVQDCGCRKSEPTSRCG
nr:unnamed protein product [Digitaria exilis]